MDLQIHNAKYYIITNDGVILFPIHSTPNADWSSHWSANDKPFIYDIVLIKKWMNPSFDQLKVHSCHPDALNSKLRLRLPLLVPQWHPVVNYRDGRQTERERIRCWYKESKIGRQTERNRVCAYFGNPSRVQMNISTRYWSRHCHYYSLSRLSHLPHPVSPSFARCQIQIRLIFFLHPLPFSCSDCLSLIWCPRV